MNIKKILLTTVLLGTSVFSFHSTAWANTYQQAVSALQREDYQTAFKLLKSEAEKGNAAAQSNLAVMYFKGKGVKQNNAEGIKWLRKSANQGDADAQFNMAVAYEKGLGVKKNPVEFVKWLRKAAEQGHLESQYLLGLEYVTVDGGPNVVEAAKWLKKACDGDYPDACYILEQVNELKKLNDLKKLLNGL